MPHVCGKCARVNPQDAAYCYYDGIALNGHANGGGPVSIGRQAFNSPFTLPSGKVCQNFDQLALGCQEDLKAAADVLKQGYLEKFLASQGRADLAMAARQAATSPDKLRGLDDFLAKLPTQALQEPKLIVEPTDINLGVLKFGEDRKIELKLENQGMRLIYGSVIVENGLWLSLGTTPGVQQKLFQFGNDLVMPVVVQGKKLRASNKPLEAKLIIESNAGNMMVTVKADVPVKPYPNGVLAGARSPRQVAEKAKLNPKESAELFEKGAVAAWYKDNGWTYPVRGPAASGLGAVQQFFEALGLTPPPKVEVSEKQVAMQGEGGQQIRHQLEIRSQEKRPVYAHGTSDQPWLEVGRPRLNGRVASIPLVVPNVPGRPGETLKARVTITANGNQRFVIPVTLTIGGGNNLFTPLIPTGGGFGAGGDGPLVADTPLVKMHRNRSNIQLWPLLLLFLCLCGVAAWDLFRPGTAPEIVDLGDIKSSNKSVPNDAIKPHDYENRLALSFSEELSRFGLTLPKVADPRYPEKFKQLTRYENGLSNNTCVKIEGFEYVFGRENVGAGVRYWRDKKDGKLVKNKKIGDRQYQTTMYYEGQKIMVSQIVEIVIGEQTRLFDTLLVKYNITNFDEREHSVAIRVMLDTYIGANDGVPIEIGPSEDVKTISMVDTMAVLEKGKMPDYIRAVEDPNRLGEKTNTVVEMGLKLRNFEPIQKLVVCRWPQDQGATEARWDWNYEAMNHGGKEPDSCVVLYWANLKMAPKEPRTVGYTYGLGRVAGEVGDKDTTVFTSKMRLLPRPARVDRPFALSAYTKGAKGQIVKLEYPGLTLVTGPESQTVKEEEGKAGVTTWQLKAAKEGTYKVKATLGDGTVAEDAVVVTKGGIFD